jgi:hypothetical protein
MRTIPVISLCCECPDKKIKDPAPPLLPQPAPNRPYLSGIKIQWVPTFFRECCEPRNYVRFLLLKP